MTGSVIPQTWNSLSLGELTAETRPICYGVLKPGDFRDDGVPLIRVTDISENWFDASRMIRISRTLDEEFRRSRLRGGEILISIQGTIGRVAMVPPEYAGANISRTIAVIEPDRRADPRFVYWYLRFLGEGAAFHTVGSTRSSLNIEALRRVQIPLPDLPQQRRIAEVLDRAEALRTKRRGALAQLDTLSLSIFLNMFGDPKSNPLGWPARDFESTMRDETSRSEKLQQSQFLPHGLYPVIDQGQSEIAGYCDDRRYLCQSELPVVVFGDHTRAVKLVGEPFVVGADGAKVLAPQPDVNAVFLSWMIRLSPIPDLGYSRHMREVKRLRFPTPPLAAQLAFARQVEVVESLRRPLRASQNQLAALLVSLQHRAFRGEL